MPSMDLPFWMLRHSAGDSSDGHIATAGVGPQSTDPLLNTGVLSESDDASQSPISADVAHGANLANVNALSGVDQVNGDTLHFADLGGAGTDSLTGLVPSISDGGLLNGLSGGEAGPATSDDALIDGHTDGGQDLVQLHTDHPGALVGLNDHAVI